MRQILLVVAAAVAISISVVSAYEYHTSADTGADTGKNEAMAYTGADQQYYGDTLYQHDGKTMVYDYSFIDDEITSLTKSAIVTYQGRVPVDTCVVNGNGWWYADGDTLKFSIGVDTVYYRFRQLPASVYPERELLPPGIGECTYSHSFSLTDSLPDCDFVFRAYLPENPPLWLKHIISVIMRNDINEIYYADQNETTMMDEYKYNGISKVPENISRPDVSGKTPEEIARHYSKEYERLYREDFGDDDSAPKYDYLMHLAPAWESADRKYVTYRFYSYHYTMGIHGLMQEYYLTFNAETGDILGFSDLFLAKDAHLITDMLDSKLTGRRNDMGYENEYCAPGFKNGDPRVLIKERHDTLYYPRPAMTGNGVVFSYQPYEAAAFAYGIVHVILPYPEIEKFLRINP